jgi:DNA-directed RNA polymerase specialized sigma24 family protein
MLQSVRLPSTEKSAMSSEGSISHWIAEIKDGDSAGARGIWERYFPRLVELAGKQIRGVPRGMADEEDVALSALDSFCRAAREGRFPDLADRDGLWRLLLQMTVHKAIGLARHERRQRRGGGRVQSLDDDEMVSDEGLVAEIVGREPTPEFAAMMADECRRLLEKLDDPQLRELAVAKMEGYGNEEIARRLGCSLRTVERRLRLIRKEWKHDIK